MIYQIRLTNLKRGSSRNRLLQIHLLIYNWVIWLSIQAGFLTEVKKRRQVQPRRSNLLGAVQTTTMHKPCIRNLAVLKPWMLVENLEETAFLFPSVLVETGQPTRAANILRAERWKQWNPLHWNVNHLHIRSQFSKHGESSALRRVSIRFWLRGIRWCRFLRTRSGWWRRARFRHVSRQMLMTFLQNPVYSARLLRAAGFLSKRNLIHVRRYI